MAQIVRNESNFGQNLAAGLSQFANRKLQQMDARHQQEARIKALSGTGKLTPQEASFISSLPEQNQWEAAQTLAQQRSSQESPQGFTPQQLAQAGIPEDDHAGFQEFLQQQSYGKMNPMEMLQQSLNEGQRPPMGVGEVLQQLQSRNAPIEQQQQAGLQEQALGRQQQEYAPQPNRPAQQAAPQAPEQAIAPRAPLGLTKEQRQQQYKEMVAQRAASKAEDARIQAETKPYVDKLLLEKDQADFAEPRLNKMKQLIKKGRLPSAAEYKILKSIEDHLTPLSGAGAGAAVGGALGALGGPAGYAAGATAGGALGAGIGALVGPVVTVLHNLNKATFAKDEEQFEKLTASFLRGAKDVFGGRFTEKEMAQYLAGLPNLAQTDEGKLAVIEDMELFNKAANVKYRAMRQIIRENGGKRPADLREQVEQRSAAQLNKLSDIFREDLL